MLTHFGNFLCGLGGKGPFKTDAALWSVALRPAFLFDSYNILEKYSFTNSTSSTWMDFPFK